MSRAAALVVGAATLAPLVSVLALGAILAAAGNGFALAVVAALTLAWVVVLLVLYIVHVFRNPHLPETHRTPWVVALLFASLVAMPVYWYRHVWPDAARRSG